jgi:FkbM family methyltransferase
METIAKAVPDGPKFYLSTRWLCEYTTWFYGSAEYFGDIYRWIRHNARGDWVTFDVGMNFGFFACVLAQRCAQSHGFEPVPWLADRAEANMKLNHFTNLLINRVALSNQAGETELFIPSPNGNWGASSILRTTVGAPILVPTVTLDQYVSQHGLTRLDFIKIDVEGAEDLVLEGAIESLKAFHPAIIFEGNPESATRCEQLLHSTGYTLTNMDPFRSDILALH